jgi:hypothetical protein
MGVLLVLYVSLPEGWFWETVDFHSLSATKGNVMDGLLESASCLANRSQIILNAGSD